MILFGTNLMGKVEETPSGYYIATAFFHVCFFPLMPLDSYIVTKPGLVNWQGIPIGLDGKSMIMGYVRGAACAGIFVAMIALTVLADADGATVAQVRGAWRTLIIGGMGLIVLPISYLRTFTAASPEWVKFIEHTVRVAGRDEAAS